MTGNHSVDAFSKEGEYRLEKDVTRVLFLPDIHVPEHCEKTLSAILSYVKENKFDLLVQLGDFLDLDILSRFNAENLKKLEGARILKEFEEGNKVLDRIQAAVRNKNPEAHIVVLEGNHDQRLTRLEEKQPAFIGMVDMDSHLRFDDRHVMFWKYWTHKKPLKIGKLHAIHGEYLGTFHSKKTCEAFGRSVVYGHTHDAQQFTKVSFGSEAIQCFSIGTLSKLNLDYMGHKPSAWINCFGQAFIQKNGNFNFYTTNVIDGSFVGMDGKKYS